MENLENSSLEQSENITPPQAGTSFFSKLKSKWLVITAVATFVVLASGVRWGE